MRNHEAGDPPGAHSAPHYTLISMVEVGTGLERKDSLDFPFGLLAGGVGEDVYCRQNGGFHVNLAIFKR